jgi:acyl-coenzyme A synthetase/AMP-(fatty) acid ligase
MSRAPRSAGAIPLSHLPGDTRPGEDRVCFDRAGGWTREHLRGRAAAVAARVDALGRGRWLLAVRRSDLAAASLLGLAQARSVAVLPPNAQRETLRRLALGARGILCDNELSSDDVELPRVDVTSLRPAPSVDRALLDRDAAWLELHTSGTTGEPRCTVKQVRHLEDEVAALESLFARHLPADARIFASVPHHHIYGLLFRVLWPLAAGRPFQSETLLHVRELLPRMAEGGPCALVTTPSHLRHVAAGDGLRALRGRCGAVFSSGAPLDEETAKRVAELLGDAPFEVLGSTETGGAAVRQRSLHGEAWSPFPQVSVSADPDSGRLQVTSPFASEGEDAQGGRRRFRMGDCIELLPGGGFRLLERADRTVKIAGKRLSLPQMERELERHAWVDEVALTVRETRGERRVAAALVLSPAGRGALERDGRAALVRAVSSHLAGGFDPVLLPRTWRCVEALPRNAQGKLPREALDALFAAETRTLRRALEVPSDLPTLEGHFEEHPVVPGVTQIGWALEAAAELLDAEPVVHAFEALKFPTPLRPGDRCTLTVEAEGHVLRFRLADADEGGRVFATGRARIEQEAL